MLLIILTFLNVIEKRVISTYSMFHIEIEANDRAGLVDEIKRTLKRRERKINTFLLTKDLDERSVCLEFVIKVWQDEVLDVLADELAMVPGVHKIKISE